MANKYIAYDGKVFDNYGDFHTYQFEEDLRLTELSSKIPQSKTWNACDEFPFFGCDDEIKAVKIMNMEHVNLINTLMDVRGDSYGRKLTSDDIGTVHIFSFSSDFIDHLGTPDEMKRKYCYMIDRLFAIKGEWHE